MLSKKIFVRWACAALLIAQPVSAETVQQMASNGVYAAMRVFGSGVYVPTAGASGQTSVVWSGPQMDVYARTYDLQSNSWGPTFQIYNNAWSYDFAYHNYPIIIRAPNGRLLIFQFKHNEQGYLFRPNAADTVDTTWTRTQILGGAEKPAYPTAIVAGSKILLFYRQEITDTYRTLKLITSDDNGATWSAPATVIDNGGQDSGNIDTIYPDDIGYEAASGTLPARVRLTFHMAGGAFNNQKTRNVYLVYMDPANNNFSTVDGTSLGTSISGSEINSGASNKMLVREVLPTGTILQAVGDNTPSRPIFSQQSKPLVAYNADFGSGQKPYTSYWNGSAWTHNRLKVGTVNKEGTIADLQYIDSNTNRLFVNDGLVLTAYETSNQGSSWSQAWSLNLTNNMIGGADRLTYVNVIGKPGDEIQALIGTHKSADRLTNYTGDWGVLALKD
jgi:BNR repeat-containing family member